MESKWNRLIEDFFKDDHASEIVANDYDMIFVKLKKGKSRAKSPFDSREDYIESIKELANLINKDTSDFLIEGALRTSWGTTRVHITMPPVSLCPQVTLAKRSNSIRNLDDFVKNNSMSLEMANFIKAATNIGQTIVLSGGTGVGKTTLLEAITREWKDTLRVGVVEDSPELKLSQRDVVYLESTLWKPGLDTNNIATLQWCVQQVNRMRTDRLIIGETRGKEFFDFIQAANSGQSGSLTTIHAESPIMALQKMTQFILMAMNQSTRVANTSLSNTVDIIIQLKRFGNKYKVDEIAQVSKILSNDENAAPAVSSLFKYNELDDTWANNAPSAMSDELKNKMSKDYSLYGFNRKIRRN